MNSAIRVTDGGGMRRVEIDRPEKADALDTGMMLEIARGECELQAQEHALVELIDALASLEIPVLALAHGRTLGAGGQQRSLLEQIAFIEEMERANAPRAGAAIQASALMLFGTPAQQARHMPEILRGEAIHGMGYSEPNAGSDLAVLRTTAARDGDEWVIDGQKIWTTTYWGQYMFLGARTDPKAKLQHAGTSTFIVPMNSPGISVKPSRTMYDGSFPNIFYDNVRLPADALLGAENGGWKVLTSALATERGLVGGGIVLKVARLFERLCKQVRETRAQGEPLDADPLVRERIACLAPEIEVGRQLMMQCAELAADGGKGHWPI